MPKYGIAIPNVGAGDKADAAHFARRWVGRAAYGRIQSPMAVAELEWLAICARQPRFMPGPKDSIAAVGIGDGLGSEERAKKFVQIFTDHPDEAPTFWQWCRGLRRTKAPTQLARARWAVVGFAIQGKAVNWKPIAGDVLAYLEKQYPKEHWTRRVVDDALKAERGKLSGRNRRKKT